MTKNKNEIELFEYENDYSKNIVVCDKFDYIPKIYTISFFHEFDYDARKYRPYFDVFDRAKPEDTIIVYFNSGGGSIYTLNLFLNAVRRCRCHNVIARVNYAASAAALLALYCDKIEFNKDSTIMLHTFSSAQWGKSQEIEADFTHLKNNFKKMQGKILSRILSEKEIEELYNGKDFYFDEIEAFSRIQKYTKILNKKNKKNAERENK